MICGRKQSETEAVHACVGVCLKAERGRQREGSLTGCKQPVKGVF